MNLLFEAFVVGLGIAIMGFIVSSIIGLFTNNKKSDTRDWNKYYIMEIALFLTGFIFHLVCELLGINTWYCKYGRACMK